jgi:polyisoprenoid-binding protein YceI
MNVRSLVSKVSAAVVLAAAVCASTASAASSTWKIDPVHSTVLFRIHHMNAGFTYGRFNKLSGSIVLDDANLGASSVSVEIETASVDTNSEARDKHLRTADFFDAGQFPTITFASTSVKKNGDAAYDVTGDLTLHGVKKSITVKMDKTGEGKDMKGAALVGFEGTVTILRSEYGIKTYLPNLGDEVRLTLAFEAIKQ